MDDCECDIVPDEQITVRTETICPVCRGRVTFLSAEDFERVLKAVLLNQSNADWSRVFFFLCLTGCIVSSSQHQLLH